MLAYHLMNRDHLLAPLQHQRNSPPGGKEDRMDISRKDRTLRDTSFRFDCAFLLTYREVQQHFLCGVIYPVASGSTDSLCGHQASLVFVHREASDNRDT